MEVVTDPIFLRDFQLEYHIPRYTVYGIVLPT